MEDDEQPKPKRDNRGRWLPGECPNRTGRTRKKALMLRDQLSEHQPELLTKLVSMAMDGDTAALKICFDRLMPPLKPVALPTSISLPPNATLTQKAQSIIAAAASGKLDTGEAGQLIQALAACARIFETDEILSRLEKLEQKQHYK